MILFSHYFSIFELYENVAFRVLIGLPSFKFY